MEEGLTLAGTRRLTRLPREKYHQKKPAKDRDDEEDWGDEDEEEESDNYSPWDIPKDQTKDQSKEVTESSKQGEQRGGKKNCGEAANTSEIPVEVEEVQEIMAPAQDENLPKVTNSHGMTVQDLNAKEISQTCMEALVQEEVEDKMEEVMVADASPKAAQLSVQVDADGFQQKKLKTTHKSQIAGRASSRVVGTGTPIPLRAERRAAWADSQGINSNPFSILQNIDNELLAKVAVECSIILVDNEEEVDACIDLIKARELARATLAEAEKKREDPQVEGVGITEEMSDDETNEDHVRLIQSFKEVTDLEEEVFDLEVVNLCPKGDSRNRPK